MVNVSLFINELMKDISGFENRYAVTTCGRVWSYKNNRWLKPWYRAGYVRVELSNRTYDIQTLVMRTFNPTEDSSLEVNHKDGVKDNNRFDNLEWVTHKINCEHAVNVLGKGRGEAHSRHKLTKNDVFFIRNSRSVGSNHTKILAERFGVSRQTIRDIKYGRTWKEKSLG